MPDRDRFVSGAWLRAGGGFSWQFMAPKHQHAEVQKYLANTKGLPAQSSFNRMGRGYPDISAVAVMGTSESSPTVAGIFSMITDHRLKQGADNSFDDADVLLSESFSGWKLVKSFCHSRVLRLR